MLSNKMHLLIKSLDTCHVRLRVIGQLHLLTTADMLGAPVEISHVDRTSHLACNGVEACLPTLYRLACSFWSKREMCCRKGFHLLDHAQGYITASLSVNRYATELAQKPSERTYEKFTLYHAVRLSAYRHIIKVRDHEIPDRGVRHTENDAFIFGCSRSIGRPSHGFKKPSAEFSPHN